MGRLTDLLNKRGMIEGLQEDTLDKEASKTANLGDKFPHENVIDEIKEFLQEASNKRSKKKIFEALPNIGEFYIPAMMNGRVIECSDTSFQPRKGEQVICAKAYHFDGYELKYLFFDNADDSLQRGSFDEFPRDGYGKTMGQVGIKDDTLCWVTKKSKNV